MPRWGMRRDRHYGTEMEPSIRGNGAVVKPRWGLRGRRCAVNPGCAAIRGDPGLWNLTPLA